MLKKLLIAFSIVVGLLLVFVVYVALQPADFRVERSTTIAAPPTAIFPHVNDLHLWEEWSPWAKLDPNAVGRYEGPGAGEGAVFHWDGNSEVGAGSMTIVESRPPERVKIHLHFLRPFEDEGDSEFVLLPQGDDTLITWSMSGQNNWVGRLVCLFMDMDEMIGSQYEKGLASLKQIVESTEVDPSPAANNDSDSTEGA